MYFRISHISCIGHNVFVTGYLSAEGNKPEQKEDLETIVKCVQEINVGISKIDSVEVENNRVIYKHVEASNLFSLLRFLDITLDLDIKYRLSKNIKLTGKDALEELDKIAKNKKIKVIR
ncbi:hypothetical protein [[Clostridium] fimetarium]|uniref:Uncharacterized protein n=1 Tax=[Clostridium] fimetarium TaxID=99656 RepID=A0A1I0RDE9_9FIRM|nr:hypothetical protein [[Clostridium] fimetarium]SEW38823.1 hypothetical protein SAMN05421659_11446 [[Clostridium] fimetarium]